MSSDSSIDLDLPLRPSTSPTRGVHSYGSHSGIGVPEEGGGDLSKLQVDIDVAMNSSRKVVDFGEEESAAGSGTGRGTKRKLVIEHANVTDTRLGETMTQPKESTPPDRRAESPSPRRDDGEENTSLAATVLSERLKSRLRDKLHVLEFKYKEMENKLKKKTRSLWSLRRACFLATVGKDHNGSCDVEAGRAVVWRRVLDSRLPSLHDVYNGDMLSIDGLGKPQGEAVRVGTKPSEGGESAEDRRKDSTGFLTAVAGTLVTVSDLSYQILSRGRTFPDVTWDFPPTVGDTNATASQVSLCVRGVVRNPSRR